VPANSDLYFAFAEVEMPLDTEDGQSGCTLAGFQIQHLNAAGRNPQCAAHACCTSLFGS
ncbi:hypothetical protein STEG23_030943, partial [Scotinomys teguina]